jgi:hypothetical protein
VKEKTPLNFLQAGRTAGPEQRRGPKHSLMVQLFSEMSSKKQNNFQVEKIGKGYHRAGSAREL